MSKQRSPEKHQFLQTPVRPIESTAPQSTDDLLSRMEQISFQGRNLAIGRRIWERMIVDDVLIFFGIAGALTAGGLRLTVAQLIHNRAFDCLVSTGANLYHDLHETRGQHHYLGSPKANDAALQAQHIDRVYDTYIDEDEFIGNDNWIAEFASTLERRPYTSRELLHHLGGHLWKTTGADGILTAAYRHNLPIFCPAIADSSLGMGLSQARHISEHAGQIDVIGDIIESANLVIRHPKTASIVLGGGTPKNFINQASVQAAFYSPGIEGHQYALQIVTDVPHFGGASGSTLDEAQSWGKLSTEADRITVHADATLAFPLLTSAFIDSAAENLKDRTAPKFSTEAKFIVMDGHRIPSNKFLATDDRES
ncbi:MAG: deoxyhypusine synthase family protein [Acidobacteriota bacterium]|nr:deoxyhypusine synthase family protein [Acidobacteriota bacterium]